MKKSIEKYFTKAKIKSFVLLNIGLLIVAFPFVFFLDPNNVVYGGISALAIVIRNVSGNPDWMNTSFLIFGMNMLLLVCGFIFLERSFFLKTIYGSLAYPVYAFVFEKFYRLIETKTTLLNDLYQSNNWLILLIVSAVFTGVGLGLVLRQDASTGGVDIIQAIILKFLHLPFSTSLIIIDGIIVVFGSVLLGVGGEVIMMILYGGIFIFICGRVVDSIVFSGFNVREVNIITKKPDEVKELIYLLFDRGVTEIYARGGFTQKDCKVLVCLMSAREFNTLRAKIKSIDSHVFMYVNRATEVHGEGFSYKGVSD